MKKSIAIAGALTALKKPFLIMKLTILLTVLCTLQCFSGAKGQGITLNIQNEEIKKVLSTIEKQSNYRFLFNSRLKDLQQKVTVAVANEEISSVLNQLFNGTTLVFKKLENDLIAIRSNSPDETDIKVTGHVTNDNGDNLAGVSVVVKGTAQGTTTDNKGDFAITVADNATLIISAVGYLDQEVAVNGQTVLNVLMVRSTKTIDQVVVIGYGSARKKDLTGSSVSIKGSDIANIPSVSAAQAIQGKAAGVQITNSGAPGSAPNVRIRGTGSILGGVDPLYVVDGIITGDIRNINSSDILSIDILKDASSTAIYGARAANGVVLITTKAGNKGKFSVTYNAFAGVKMLTHKVEMAGPNLFAVYSNDAAGAPEITGADITGTPNWYDEITRIAFFHNHNLSLSGGKNKYRYFASFGYLSEDGTLIGNNYERFTVRFNHDYTVNAKLKFGNNIGFSHYKSENKPYSLFTTAYIAAPIFSPYNPNGTYGNTIKSDVGNPLASLLTTNDRSFGNRLTGALWGEYQIISGLSFRSSFGIDLEQNNGWNYSPQYNTYLLDGTEAGQRNLAADLTFTRDSIYQWTWDNYLAYEKKLGKDHDLKVTAGHTAERRNGWSQRAEISDNNNISKTPDGWKLNFTDTAMGQRNFRTAIGNYFKRESYFLRLNYRFMDKYLLNASLRRDANSNFSKTNRWGNFPSVGAGWIITREAFMAKQKIFDDLKLRASYGLVGNDVVRPGAFDLRPDYDLYAYFGTDEINGAIPTRIVDPNLKWEVVKEFDAGIEFSMLSRKLTGEIDFYHKKATDALYTIKLVSLGFGRDFVTNAADILNTGVEISLAWSDQTKNKKVSYNLRGNVTFNKNRVESIGIGQAIFDGSLNNGFNATKTSVGYPVGSFYVYKTNGIFQTDAEVAAYPHLSSARPGDFRLVDIDNNGVIDDKDRVFGGSYQPKIYFGFNASATWKKFDFSIDIFGNAGNKVYNAKKGVRYGGNYNIEYDVAINRWVPGSNNNTTPRAFNGTQVPTDYFVESGSFVRINNITVGYTVQPKSKKLHIDKFRVYASAQNPFILTKYTGFTPELPGTALASGIELNVYPISASYMLGVNVQFK